jgi:molybdenum cofactor guanylyltransferase
MGYSGAVLAGGASKRFGEDKALFPYRGKPLLQWVLESLQGAQERFVVANRPYEGFGVPVYPDLLPGADSLSGLHSALSHARHPLGGGGRLRPPLPQPGLLGLPL